MVQILSFLQLFYPLLIVGIIWAFDRPFTALQRSLITMIFTLNIFLGLLVSDYSLDFSLLKLLSFQLTPIAFQFPSINHLILQVIVNLFFLCLIVKGNRYTKIEIFKKALLFGVIHWSFYSGNLITLLSFFLLALILISFRPKEDIGFNGLFFWVGIGMIFVNLFLVFKNIDLLFSSWLSILGFLIVFYDLFEHREYMAWEDFITMLGLIVIFSLVGLDLMGGELFGEFSTNFKFLIGFIAFFSFFKSLTYSNEKKYLEGISFYFMGLFLILLSLVDLFGYSEVFSFGALGLSALGYLVVLKRFFSKAYFVELEVIGLLLFSFIPFSLTFTLTQKILPSIKGVGGILLIGFLLIINLFILKLIYKEINLNDNFKGLSLRKFTLVAPLIVWIIVMKYDLINSFMVLK